MPLYDDNAELRRDRRVMFSLPAPLAVQSGDGRLLEDSSTIDLSESGIRIRLRGQLQPGQTVDVFLNKLPERCRVVWTAPSDIDNGSIAGLQFLYPLPDPQAPKPPRFEV